MYESELSLIFRKSTAYMRFPWPYFSQYLHAVSTYDEFTEINFCESSYPDIALPLPCHRVSAFRRPSPSGGGTEMVIRL
jgi:hypothetical protein